MKSENENAVFSPKSLSEIWHFRAGETQNKKEWKRNGRKGTEGRGENAPTPSLEINFWLRPWACGHAAVYAALECLSRSVLHAARWNNCDISNLRDRSSSSSWASQGARVCSASVDWVEQSDETVLTGLLELRLAVCGT